ncbi:50S ribosomal protein L34e [Candidatus Micrarchaeota archaeon]|nr:50S ribosomal protein L34e [Candidatus Micrarchaeota archaeon]
MNRSRYRMKKRSRRTPSGRTSLLIRNKKPKIAPCALCRTPMGGIPRATRTEMRKLSATQRRPQRAFGGVLCGACTASVIKTRTRLQSGIADETKVPLTLMKYVKMLKA